VSQIIDFFQQGGIFMLPIAVCLLFALIIVIDRGFKVYYLYSIDSEKFVSQIQNLVMNKNYDQAVTLCNAKDTALLPQVLKAALKEATSPVEKIHARIEQATLSAIPQLEKRQSFLPMLANAATLLGLLGTVIGLIEAFTAVAHADPSKKAELLTQSISIAMNTTAFGLIVAIPTTVFHTLIQERIAKIVGDIDQYSLQIAHLIGLNKSK
jgi:biopolymer transport protein ExbB/TolQ